MAGHMNILPEGSSINRPPGFNGKDYIFWKIKMRTYIKANGMKLWRVVERGNLVPSNLVGEPKPEHEWTD